MKRYSVAICDDHRLFADSLSMVLRSRNWGQVRSFAHPSQIVTAARADHIDACLLDLTFPDGANGLSYLDELREVAPGIKIIVITASSDPALLAQARDAGVEAILFKDEDIEQIIEVTKRVLLVEDHRHLVAIEPPRRSLNPDPCDSLTPRERETLERLTLGETGTELAAAMGIKYSTARTHVQNVMMKLGVHSRLEAVAHAISHSIAGTHPNGHNGANGNAHANGNGNANTPRRRASDRVHEAIR